MFESLEDSYPWTCNICESSEHIRVVNVRSKTDRVVIEIDCKNDHGIRLLGKRVVSKEYWDEIKDEVVWD